MNVKQKVAWFLSCIAVLMVVGIPAFASDGESGITPYYSETSSISATLDITNGVATCIGIVTPIYDQDCFITVTLYKKSGDNWSKVKSWSASGTEGRQAAVVGTRSVDRGVYKVISVGLSGLETTKAESPIETY